MRYVDDNGDYPRRSGGIPNDNSVYVTRQELFEKLREIQNDFHSSENRMTSRFDKDDISMDKTAALLAKEYEKSMSVIDRRLGSQDASLVGLRNKMDESFKYIVGAAIAALVSTLIMVGGVLLGKF